MSDTTRTLIRYKNRARALVTVTEHEASSDVLRYTAECAGCFDSRAGDGSNGRCLLRDARKWAGTHASECRALPQPDTQV